MHYLRFLLLALVALLIKSSSVRATCAKGVLVQFSQDRKLGDNQINIALKTAQSYFSSWTYAVPGDWITGLGKNSPGDLRRYLLFGDRKNAQSISITETLERFEIQSNGTIDAAWQTTSPFNWIGPSQDASAESVSVYGLHHSMEVYVDEVTQDTMINYSVDMCASSRERGLDLATKIVKKSIKDYWKKKMVVFEANKYQSRHLR